MTESINTVVIGAGVIGLACAKALAEDGREVLVIDRNAGIGEETSSRNSEVIHAGIYYAADSFKARFCVSGKHALYDYCESRGIPHKRIGKLIVAPRETDIERLKTLQQRAIRNGVDDLRWIESAEIKALEPELGAAAALLSPSTGIIDAHSFMLALQGDIEAGGGHVVLRSSLIEARQSGSAIELTIDSGGSSMRVNAHNVVNCAGLHASTVAKMLHGDSIAIPQTAFARGVYFAYTGKSPFSRLIYPLPEPGGLGIHATIDMAGSLRFGPDVEWVDELDYSVNPDRAELFATAIRSWWPALEGDRLKPAYAGIRPKIARPGEAPADFHFIRTPHSNSAIVDLLGIESPGLTSALAIAGHVSELLR